MTVERATKILEEHGFEVSVGEMRDSSYDRGLVAYTYPGDGDQVSSGDTVVIYPSDGTPYVPPKKKPKKPRAGGGGDDDGRRGGGGRGRGGGD
jgi:beta-lactam-binding protein with PASTA domain